MHLPVVEDVFVDLIAEDVEIELLGHGTDGVDLVALQHAAGRIVGATCHQRLGLFGDVRPQLCLGDAEIRLCGQRHMHGDAPVQLHHGRIAHPRRVEDHHLVAGIEERGQRGVDRPLAARRHHDLIRRHMDVVLTRQLGRNRLQQRRRPKRGGIVCVPVADGGKAGFLNVLGCVEIRFTTGQVDDVFARGL